VRRRAEAFIDANPQSTLRIDALCSAACTSLSTLQRAFREAFGVSLNGEVGIARGKQQLFVIVGQIRREGTMSCYWSAPRISPMK
jgi:AraC-like DNA-binding protein